MTAFFLAQTDHEIFKELRLLGASETLEEVKKELQTFEPDDIKKLGIFEITVKRITP